ncbi:hypothetical protein C9I50_11325 [Pseudomonas prosekii]|nr:hypothetical protein C9I50_11325 [Pseudomonas prosekii]
MRDLTNAEVLAVYGAQGGLTVSAETVGGAVGGTIGGLVGGPIGGGVGAVVGAAVANSLANGTRTTGSVGSSGIPWGASMGGAYTPIGA